MNLRERVRDLLKERGSSQAQLAQASGLDASVLSRLLSGDRPWRREHIACVSASLSMTPEELTKDTDAQVDDGVEIDAEFVATLTRAHGTLVAENARLAEELAATTAKLKDYGEEQKKLIEQQGQLELALDREKRARATAEAAKREAEVREAELVRQVSALKAERSALRDELQTTRHQVAALQTAYAKAAEVANRNYAVAKDLERRRSAAKSVAKATSLTAAGLGLAMVIGSALNESKTDKRRRRRGG